jgi:hypothetical protein
MAVVEVDHVLQTVPFGCLIHPSGFDGSQGEGFLAENVLSLLSGGKPDLALGVSRCCFATTSISEPAMTASQERVLDSHSVRCLFQIVLQTAQSLHYWCGFHR